MRRNPRTDPREGDVWYQANGTRELHVDKVDAQEVVCCVTDGCGGLLGSHIIPLSDWRESTPSTCDESEMSCPACDGLGDVCKIAPDGLFGKEVYAKCRMCGGVGRLYLDKHVGEEKENR